MFKDKILVLSSVAILFGGCGVQNLQNSIGLSSNQEPQWLLNPYYQNDKIAAVGCAKQHINGIEAQKKLAISRAIDQIATQKRVKVDNVTLRRKSSSNGRRGNSSSESSSLQTVDNVSISTKTKAIYKKPNGDICAWVVAR